MSNVKSSLWKWHLDGAEDVTSRLRSVIDTGVSQIKLPAGKFKITSPLVFHDAQQLIGEGAGRDDATTGTIIMSAIEEGPALQFGDNVELCRMQRVRDFRLRGPGRNEDPDAAATIGIQVGVVGNPYASNNFGWNDVIVERFDVGFDNLHADNSYLRGGRILFCNINGRTGQNSLIEAAYVDNTSAAKYGWQVLYGGLKVSTNVSSGQVCHFRLETGANLTSDHVWYEGDAPGSIGSNVMANNSTLRLVNVFRAGWPNFSVPFIKGEGGHIEFDSCRGAPQLTFEVFHSMNIYGMGEQGIKNGQPYTAGGYPP